MDQTETEQYIATLEGYKADAEAIIARLERSQPKWQGIALGFLLGLLVGIGAFFVWGEQIHVFVACEDFTSA